MPSVQKQLGSRPQVWQSELCGCCDYEHCGYGLCCLPCLWADNNVKFYPDVKETTGPCCKYFFCCFCAPLFASEMRRAIRTKYNLAEHPCNDCCVHCFCAPCAVCQEAREIEYMTKVDPASKYKTPSEQAMKKPAEQTMNKPAEQTMNKPARSASGGSSSKAGSKTEKKSSGSKSGSKPQRSSGSKSSNVRG